MTSSSKIDWNGLKLVFGVLLFLLCICPLYVTLSTVDRHDFSNIPAVSASDLLRQINELDKANHSPVSNDPRDYYRYVMAERHLEAIATRLGHDHGESRGTPVDIMSIRWRLDPQNLKDRYEKRFGHTLMVTTAGKMRPWIDQQEAAFAFRPAADNNHRVASAWSIAYLMTVIVGAAFFVSRIKADTSLRLWLEVVNGRLLFFSIFWLPSLWFYPQFVNPIDQLRRVKQILASLFAGSVSIGAIAGVAHAGERKGGTDVSVSAGLMSGKVTPVGVTVHQGPVATISTTVSFSNGWSANVWSSHALEAPHGSDEGDLTITKSWTTGEVHSSFSLAYYNIQPITSSAHGDMISPIYHMSRSIGQNTDLIVHAEAFLHTKVPAKDGFDVSVGVHQSGNLGKVKLSQTLSAVAVDGPFGAEAGLMGRYDASATMPIAKRASVTLFTKMLRPLFGARERKPSVTVGVNLVAAF